jgi:SAM-dependent methyltransferase
LIADLPDATVELLIEEIISSSGLPTAKAGISMLPDLAVRHAGSEIFQEAHFALTSSGDRDLFDWISPATSTVRTRGTSHFTPPALARSLVEQSFKEIGDMPSLANLTVLDPACGSGSFLYEAIRTARRLGFNGELKVVGRDISIAAVDMARFTLKFAAGDWTPAGGILIDIQAADALDAPLPKADVVLMNPPFMAWTAMTREQRERVREILQGMTKGRVDLSMAFVSRALDAVRPGGAIGAVMPASVLASSAAESWRSEIREKADLRLIGSLGEYGLFAHATVNVAVVVARRREENQEADKQEILAVVSGRSSEATGDALRAIRGATDIPVSETAESRWQIFHMSQSFLDAAPNWRPVAPEVVEAIERTEALGLTRPLGDIFEVLQGARTGWVKGFVLSEAEIASLGRQERRFFRPAAMGDNIVEGHLEPDQMVFFPYSSEGLLLGSEEELERRAPSYFERYLQPNKKYLSSRTTHKGRADWWTLARPRGWNSSCRPRIVSKYFGSVGGFALDPEGAFVVVQGFGWFLRRTKKPTTPETDYAFHEDASEEEAAEYLEAEDATATSEMSEIDLLAAYVALFNSTVFEKLLATFSSHVAGGQYDLSWRFVRAIPVPDFDGMWRNEGRASEIARLVELGRAPAPEDRVWARQVERLLYGFYGADLLDSL